MADFVSLLDLMLEPFVFMIALLYLYGLLARSKLSRAAQSAVLGAIFSTVIAYSMTHPLTVAEGVIFDLRNLFVGVAVALFHPLAGAVALLTGFAVRIAIGGAGMWPGLVGLSLAALGGLIWRLSYKGTQLPSARSLLFLGLCISVHLLGFLTIEQPVRGEVLRTIAPYLLVSNFLGALIVGTLLRRENMLIFEERRLAEAAAVDPLTKLLNRRSAEQAVSRLPAIEDTQLGRAILYFDVDRFKRINDSFGHAAGDMVLQRVTDEIRKCLRPQDLFARLGGDEFAIILPSVQRDDARTVAERCREVTQNLDIRVDGKPITITISIGVRWSETPAEFTAQLSEADSALYVAKAKGRNQVAFHSKAGAARVDDAGTYPDQSR